MRRVVYRIAFALITFLFLFKGLVVAQERVTAPQLLKRMVNAIESREVVSFEFDMNNLNGDGSLAGLISGSVVSKGAAFTLITPYLEVFCDGVTKWIFNAAEQELVILQNDTTQIDFIENPLGFLSALAKGDSPFRTLSNHSGDDVGGECRDLWIVELAPKRRSTPYKSLTLCIAKKEYLPKRIMIKNLDESFYNIEIKAFTEISKGDQPLFSFPEERLKGLKINDLR